MKSEFNVMSLEVTFKSDTVALPTVIDLVDVLPAVRTASRAAAGASVQLPSDLKNLSDTFDVDKGTKPALVPLNSRYSVLLSSANTQAPVPD